MTELSTAPLPARQILKMIKQSKSYWVIRKQLLSSFLKSSPSSSHSSTPIPTTPLLSKTLHSSPSLQSQLHSLITNCLDKNIKRLPLQTDPIPQVQALRLKWSENTLQSYNSVISKLEKEEGGEDQDESVNYVYDCLSFLDYMGRLKLESGVKVRELPIYLFPKNLPSLPTFKSLKPLLSFLDSPQSLSLRTPQPLYRDRQRKARRILDNDGFQTQIQQYLLHGSSNGQRTPLYMKYFNIQPQQREVMLLMQDVKQNPRERDRIFGKDVGDLLNDPGYFIFRLEIKMVLKMFMRDKSVREKVKVRPHTFGEKDERESQLPENNIIPCRLFAKLIAPFCYCSLKIDIIYSLFHKFYSQYFCLLHSLSSHKSSILYLCNLFQQLLDTTSRKLALHFSQLNIRPLTIVFPWIFYCYVGYIDIEQVFYLMDRIVAMKGLEVLVVYAMAVLWKERTEILGLRRGEEIREVLERSLRGDVMGETVRNYLVYHQ